MKLGANHCFDLKISRKNRKIKFLYKMQTQEASQNKTEICFHELGGVQEKRCWKDNREYQHKCNSVSTIGTKSPDSPDP